jgi:hypothetical protein
MIGATSREKVVVDPVAEVTGAAEDCATADASIGPLETDAAANDATTQRRGEILIYEGLTSMLAYERTPGT